MRFQHVRRPGFLLGFVDFFTAGLFFLGYMPLGGLQKELEFLLGHPLMPYWKAYLLGIPTLFVYPLIWMARISEELKEKAEALGIPGPHTSFRHMFIWNVFGLVLMGPAVATHRFFRTLNAIEQELNRRSEAAGSTDRTGMEETKMDSERINRVTEMEARMNRVAAWLESASGPKDTVEEDVRILETYYQSPSWREDFEAEEAGRFPEDLPRGVLSEDGLYNVLEAWEERKKEQADGLPTGCKEEKR